jgi:hypothetical protein
VQEKLAPFFENVNERLGGRVFIPPYVKYYAEIPTDMRLRIAYSLVCQWLSTYRTRSASIRPKALLALLDRLGIDTSPRDPSVFIEDLKTIEQFQVDGHTWKIREIEKQRSKGLLRIHFVRVD